MSSMPPIDSHGREMLPAVYRRTDIVRSANVAGGHPLPRRQEGKIVTANDDAPGSGYTRSGNNPAAAARPGDSCSKGMIVDVWA